MLDIEEQVKRINPLALYGIVGSVPAPNTFICEGLSGLGNNKFTNSYYVYVFRNITGTGAAPQGEIQPITAYDAATGAFSHGAFLGGPLVPGDEILIIHPVLAGAGFAGIGQGILWGRVTAVPGANQFTIPTLAGLGAGKFAGVTNPYSAFVLRDAGGLSGQPQGELQAITAYDTATGNFTAAAFTVPVGLGDEILLLHPSLAATFNLAILRGATGVFFEQVDTPVNTTATNAAETDIVNLATAATRYILRNLRLKCADPGANTVTVRLKLLVNDVLTDVDSFPITTLNFGSYFSLMDMFAIPDVAADQIQITVRASAGGPYAVTGQFSYGKNNV